MDNGGYNLEDDDELLALDDSGEAGSMVEVDGAAARRAARTPGSPSDLDCVLVIDDDQSPLRSELAALLQDAGFKVREVSSITDAIESIVQEPTDVVIQNWRNVHGADSIKMHRKLCGNSDYDGMLRVVLVEQTSPQFFSLACDLGVDKVFDSSVLEIEIPKRIRAALDDKKDELDFVRLVGSRSHSSEYDECDLDERVQRAYHAGSPSQRMKLEYGSYLVRSGKWDEAEALAADLLNNHPSDVRSLNFLARVYMKQKRFARAIEVLKQADLISPDNPDRLVMIGDALFERGDFEEAKENYEGALHIDPEVPGAQKGLGKAFLSLGDLDAALGCFQKCLSEDETASFFNNAGVIAVKMGRSEEGLRLYESALKSLQTEKYAHIILFNIALAFFRIHDLDQAAQALKASLQYNPSYGKSQRLLEAVLEKAG
jgi:tetratricopeptide (TPR) repeat protein